MRRRGTAALAALLGVLVAALVPAAARAQAPRLVRLPGADDLRFTRVSVEKGLSHGVVRTVFQDRRGFLWIGTQNGLNHYDGYRFTIYRTEPGVTHSLPGNTVTAIAETSGAAGTTPTGISRSRSGAPCCSRRSIGTCAGSAT